MLRSLRPSSSVFVRGCVHFLPPVDQRNSVKTLATLQHAISLTLWLFSCMCNTWTAQEKGKEESFQAVYGNFSTGCSSTRFPQLRGPCWLTLGWLSSLPAPLLFLRLSLRCPFSCHERSAALILWEESEPASSSEEAQSGEYCQKNNLHNTKAFVSRPFEWEMGGHCGNNMDFPLKNYGDRGVEYKRATEFVCFITST